MFCKGFDPLGCLQITTNKPFFFIRFSFSSIRAETALTIQWLTVAHQGCIWPKVVEKDKSLRHTRTSNSNMYAKWLLDDIWYLDLALLGGDHQGGYPQGDYQWVCQGHSQGDHQGSCTQRDCQGAHAQGVHQRYRAEESAKKAMPYESTKEIVTRDAVKEAAPKKSAKREAVPKEPASKTATESTQKAVPKRWAPWIVRRTLPLCWVSGTPSSRGLLRKFLIEINNTTWPPSTSLAMQEEDTQAH